MTAAAQITVSKETLDLLRKMGYEGESDDEIIRRLIRERRSFPWTSTGIRSWRTTSSSRWKNSERFQESRS